MDDRCVVDRSARKGEINQILTVMLSDRKHAGLQPMHETHRRPEEILEDVIVAQKEQSRC